MADEVKPPLKDKFLKDAEEALATEKMLKFKYKGKSPKAQDLANATYKEMKSIDDVLGYRKDKYGF